MNRVLQALDILNERRDDLYEVKIYSDGSGFICVSEDVSDDPISFDSLEELKDICVQIVFTNRELQLPGKNTEKSDKST